MPTILRIIAAVEGFAGIVLLLAAWLGSDRSFLLGLLLFVSALISAAVFMALAEILENSERMRSELGTLRDDLWRELRKPRDGGPAPSRPSPSPPPPRPSTSPIRESTDPITGRVSYLYNGVTYDSRLAAVAQLSEDERCGRQPGSPASD